MSSLPVAGVVICFGAVVFGEGDSDSQQEEDRDNDIKYPKSYPGQNRWP